MGYSHYYTIHDWDAPEWQEIWPSLTKEVPMILEAADVPFRGPWTHFSEVTPPLADDIEGIFFDGIAEDGHEPLCLNRKESGWCSVKTARKPYDIAVACTLLRAYMLSPSIVELSSDGKCDTDWKQARGLYDDLWPGEPCWCPWDDNATPEMEDSGLVRPVLVREDPRSPTATQTEMAQARPTASPNSKRQNEVSLLSSYQPVVTEACEKNIRRWLAHCEKDAAHKRCRPSSLQWATFPGVQFRVVDVFRRCITVSPDEHQYLALSYVWGDVEQPKLTGSMLNRLTQEDGLDIIWPRIPQTVRDAILFCKQIGERYLWVDALCIIQDFPRDMRLSILRMRQVYAAAKCTIGAISANTAEAGILNNLAPHNQSCLTVNSFHKLIETSPWSQRAWCYQEKVLSHRMIFFTVNGVYMQCQSGAYNGMGTSLTKEIGQPSPNRYNVVGGMLSMHIRPHDELESYLSAVEYYSARTASKKSDKMNAFQGIFQMYKGTLNRAVNTFCLGLPTFAFDQVVCWRSTQHNPGVRNPAFPSWSWLGWDHAVIFDRGIMRNGHTNQMFKQISPDKHTDIYCKKAGPGFREVTEIRKPAEYYGKRHEFGFPAILGGFDHGASVLTLFASVAKLSIASSPQESSGHDGLYPVFPGSFGEQSTEDICPPLGFIWLQKKWRECQQSPCTMDFMALAGTIDLNRPGKWTITMLMGLRHMRGDTLLEYERFQIMDCELAEQEWLELTGTIRIMYLY